MKPPPFDYAAPTSLQDAVALLAEHEGEAKIIAGGQSLMPLLNMRLARPALLVDLARVEGLDYIRAAGGGLAIGATATQRAVERSPLVAEHSPVLHEAVRFIAHPQIRNRGTMGGSLAHADPAAECPAIAVALEAELRVVGPAGERTIPAQEFFVTYLTTALAPAEVLTEVRFPPFAPGTGCSFMEVARRHGDFALAGVVAIVRRERGGRCAAARLVLFGVGATPLRARAAEEVVVGEAPGEQLFARAGAAAAAAVEEPVTDVHATADYRRDLAGILVRRALAEASARAAAS